MRNREVAEMLERQARLLSLRGENRYRIRAYKQAARAVLREQESIEKLYRENRLQKIKGVGPGMAARIKECLLTGKIGMLERAEAGELPEAENRAVLLGAALVLLDELIPELSRLPGVRAVSPAGELRRGKETIELPEIVLACGNMEKAKRALAGYARLKKLHFEGNTCRCLHVYGLPIVLHLAAEEDYARALWVLTGSEGHVLKTAALIYDKTGTDIFKPGTGNRFINEKEIYRAAGLPFIVPELREDRGEVEAAAGGTLPAVVSLEDYRGDLHVHTDWSDGGSSLEAMVAAAAEAGYSYLAITDHSQSFKVARGLTLDRLANQVQQVRKLQEKYPRLKLLAGIEVDIMDDGSLDAPDEWLARLDVVVASVHRGFRQDRAQITRRICRAMENPHVHIVAHATGRLLGKREPYEVDMDQVIKTAAATGTALEINSSPDRLDIDDLAAKKAGEAGVLIAVNTDAHSTLELANVALGIRVARRGWLEARDVINTWKTEDLLQFLRKKRV